MTPEELHELSVKLSTEKLFIQTEHELIVRLNQEVASAAAQVCESAWLSRQKRMNLNRLTYDDVSTCCRRANGLDSTKFLDAFHHLNYHESKYSTFLKLLRDDPNVLAELLVNLPSSVNLTELIDTIVTCLYGGFVSPIDEIYMASLLKKLATLLLDNPNNSADRVLTKDKCCWCQMYRTYADSMMSCKLYLSAALHPPVISLLTRDDWYYDIEPSKVIERFPPQMKAEKFGKPNTPEYTTRTLAYRQKIVKHLYEFTMSFISHIEDAMISFPATIKWLISHINQILLSTQRYTQQRARYVCSELLFDLFICPAIIDPMLYGLNSDVTVSRIARHNLMQVARILQVLSKGQMSDERQRIPDLYSLFPEDCLVRLVDDVINTTPTASLALNSSHQFTRATIFIGTQQLNTLVQIFRDAVNSLPEGSELRLRGESVTKLLPNITLGGSASVGGDSKDTPDTTPSDSPVSKPKRKLTARQKLVHADSQGSLNSIPSSSSLSSSQPPVNLQDVITINIEDTEPIGLMEEDKVLASVEESARDTSNRLDGAIKRTRFYIAQDQESIGNVSEYQASELAGDGISEAASVRSERSTNLEDAEDVDDNLSDMVSANVSGRGSPNISGRETPQSVEDGASGLDADPPTAGPASLPVTVPKPNGDLNERFGKFAIDTTTARPLDNRSLVSDTWSTDVYGSDSDQPEAPLGIIGEPPNIAEMISETASESAWSMDVLNSDTSERPIDRLKELEQIDESLSNADQESESDRFSIRSTDSRRGEPGSPFVPVRTCGAQSTQPFSSYNYSLPAFAAPTLTDSQQTAGRLNHSAGSSFTSANQQQFPFFSTNQNAPSQFNLPRLFPQTTHQDILSPQPITNQVNSSGGGANLLDLFDPLNGSVTQTSTHQAAAWTSQQQSVNLIDGSPPKTQSWVSSANQITQGRNSASNWSAATDEGRGTWASQSSIADASSTWANTDPWSVPANQSSTPKDSTNQTGFPWTTDSSVRPRTWNNAAAANIRQTVTPANRWGIVETDAADGENRPSTWATQRQVQSPVTNVVTSGQIQNGFTNQSIVTRVTPASAAASSGVIPKRNHYMRTTSQGSNEDIDSILVPARKLGKEKKPSTVLNIIKKGKRGKGSPLRQTDRSSPAMSDTKEEIASSASDDSSKVRGARGDRLDKPAVGDSNSTEDILEKYRNTKSSSTAPNKTGSTNSLPPGTDDDSEQPPAAPAIYDEENLEKCLAFADAKKKLRIVLSNPSLCSLLILSRYKLEGVSSTYMGGDSNTNFLVSFLKILYAEANVIQDLQLITQIQETIRCLQRFNNSGCYKLLKSLKEEYQSRVHYVSYLAKSRQRLLTMQSQIRGMTQVIHRDSRNSFNCLIHECVRIFLDKKEPKLDRLKLEFQKLQSPDEKAAEVEECLKFLFTEVDRDGMWNYANDEMRDAAQVAIERGLMERMYTMAMFPNGDGDTQRDRVYNENVARLSATVTPSHRRLKIPSIYHLEAPWKSAQAHLDKINAFKTPRDKLLCVCRCAETIMGLLKIAQTKAVAGADDFFPVFLFVLIKSNPMYLLSTIQYVESFYRDRMEGQEAYYWDQLTGAVNYIKMWLQEDPIPDSNESTRL